VEMNMRIGSRLLFNSILIAVLSILATALLIGYMSFHYGQQILEDEARNRLMLVRDMKADEIRRYFTAMQRECTLFSNDPTVIDAMKDLNKGFLLYAGEVSNKGMDKYKDATINNYIAEFSADYSKDNGGIAFDATPYLNATNANTFALQYNYIFNNPYGIDKEEKLTYVDDGSLYSKFHAQYHEHLRELKLLFGLEDIFLVDAKTGNIVYTVAKGLDFTTSLINGPYANTALGRVFNQANVGNGTKSVIVSEYEAYAPSNDDQACFIATPIYDNGLKVGILIFQLDANTVNEIMTSDGRWSEIGLGKTGEVYLFDANHRVLNNSRFFVEEPEGFEKLLQANSVSAEDMTRIKAKQNNIGLMKVNTYAVAEALQGKTGFIVYKDYRGVEVLGAYEPLNIGGLKWGILAKIDTAEAFSPIYALAKKLTISLLIISLLIISFAVFAGIALARQISEPIKKLSSAIRLLAESHDLTKRINYENKDEIGDMVTSLNQLLEKFQRSYQETAMSSEKVQNTAHKLMVLADEIDNREAMHKFEDNFEAVHDKTKELKTAGDALNELSGRLQQLSRQFKVFEEDSDKTNW